MDLVYGDDRATLTAEHAARYTLGDPDNPTVTLNAVDSSGCAWLADEPEGWDAPSITTPSDNQPQGHGGWLGESFYEQRTLTFTEGLCTAPDAQTAQLARRRLLAALTGSLSGLLRYTHADEAPRRSLWVRPVGRPRIKFVDDRAFVFSFVLVAEDPLKTGDPITVGPFTMRPAGTTPGRRYPRRYTFGFGGGEASTAVLLRNVGEEDAHAVYRIYGPIDRPLLLFPRAGWRAGFAMNLSAGDVLTADTRAGTIQLNGTNRYDALTAGSVVPLIPPGGVEVELRSGAGTSWPDALAFVDTAPTWL